MTSVCTVQTDYGESPDSSDIKFSPPVSEQRYETAVKLTEEHQPKKVLDMGCGPCSMIARLKWQHCIEELVGVDIDADLLRSRVFLTEPILDGHLHPREKPFCIRLYQGSISAVDHRIRDFDLLICIEVIEHLFEADLSQVPAVVFGSLRPKRALFTTPNADFNVVFRNKTARFRHHDHKFEWTRKEFANWCEAICDRYPSYRVRYIGIGAGPEGTEQYGCCTQAAVFTLNKETEGQTEESLDHSQDDHSNNTAHFDNQPYKLISEVYHPHNTKEPIPLSVRIDWEVQSCVRYLMHHRAEDFSCPNEDDSDTGDVTYMLPLQKLLKCSSKLQKLCNSDLEILKNGILTNDKLHLSKDGSALLHIDNTIEEEDDYDSASDSEDELPLVQNCQEEEDWDNAC